jgi:hypothetical protein
MLYAMRFQLLMITPMIILAHAVSVSFVQGQGRSPNSDRARAIERAEMDRLLVFALPSNKESEATRLSRFKKIKDDFRDLQSINNKMMADAWLQDVLDYSAIAEMVSKIRGKANDLKKSLSLPEPDRAEEELTVPTVTTVRKFREELLLLDKTIIGFVTNPVFQAANTLDLEQAKKASRDLEQVITLTDDVKQNAQRLRKTPH